jgi:hypothetical protein
MQVPWNGIVRVSLPSATDGSGFITIASPKMAENANPFTQSPVDKITSPSSLKDAAVVTAHRVLLAAFRGQTKPLTAASVIATAIVNNWQVFMMSIQLPQECLSLLATVQIALLQPLFGYRVRS